MKSFFLILIVLFLNFSLATAQADSEQINPAIAVAPLANGEGVKAGQAKDLTQKIENVLINHRRITVLEDQMFPKVFKKLNEQRDEIYLASTKLAEQGRLIGASYMFAGKMMSAGEDGFQINLKIVDVSTGKSISSKTYKSITHWTSRLPVGQKAKEKTAKFVDWAAILEELSGKVESDVNNFINSSFPMTYKIVRKNKEGEKGVEELMIEGGLMDGLKNKANLDVVHETVIDSDGKILRRKEIVGQARVSSVEGEVSIAQIRSGQQKVKELLDGEQNKVYLSTGRRSKFSF